MPLPSTSLPLVSLADVKAHLNLSAADTSQDVELQGFIDAATETVTYAVGPVSPTTFVETHDVTDGRNRVMLRQPPVLTVVSVVEYLGSVAHALTNQPPGSTSDFYGYSLDLPDAGLLVRRDGVGLPMPFMGGTVVVTYVAGRAAVPASVRMATLEDIRGIWQMTQQGGRPSFGGEAGENWSVGPMNFFPRLKAVLDAQLRTPGIA